MSKEEKEVNEKIASNADNPPKSRIYSTGYQIIEMAKLSGDPVPMDIDPEKGYVWTTDGYQEWNDK